MQWVLTTYGPTSLGSHLIFKRQLHAWACMFQILDHFVAVPVVYVGAVAPWAAMMWHHVMSCNIMTSHNVTSRTQLAVAPGVKSPEATGTVLLVASCIKKWWECGACCLGAHGSGWKKIAPAAAVSVQVTCAPIPLQLKKQWEQAHDHSCYWFPPSNGTQDTCLGLS